MPRGSIVRRTSYGWLLPAGMMWLLLFWSTTTSKISFAAANIAITIPATRDASILQADPDLNTGSFTSLLVGRDTTGFPGLWRTLVYFPLQETTVNNNLTLFGKLVRATLVLSIDRRRGDYRSCTIAGNTDDKTKNHTCATVHVVTVPWAEGTGFRPAIDGEVSWMYRIRPILWKTPGGDVRDGSPIGLCMPAENESNDDLATFQLNVTEMDEILRLLPGTATTTDNIFTDTTMDNDTTTNTTTLFSSFYQGFLIRDDTNPGLLDLESRECVDTNDVDLCSPRRLPPQLVLEFESPLTSVGVEDDGGGDDGDEEEEDGIHGDSGPPTNAATAADIEDDDDASLFSLSTLNTSTLAILAAIAVGCWLLGLGMGLFMCRRRRHQDWAAEMTNNSHNNDDHDDDDNHAPQKQSQGKHGLQHQTTIDETSENEGSSLEPWVDNSNRSGRSYRA